MMQRIDNIIILGRAVPEMISDGRVTVCVAGYSELLGFVRLYPTRIDSPLKMWDIVSVEVERNPNDNRMESWKFPDSRSGWDSINQHIQIAGEWPHAQRMELADSLRCACVSHLNDRRLSLGMIRPHAIHPYLKSNGMHERPYQSLFAFIEHTDVLTKKDFCLEPRVRYLCGSHCTCRGWHDQQLLDWGCYQWMRKFPGREQEIWSNLHLFDPNWLHYFLIGNQANQRTSYMVINVIRQKATFLQPGLFTQVSKEPAQDA